MQIINLLLIMKHFAYYILLIILIESSCKEKKNNTSSNDILKNSISNSRIVDDTVFKKIDIQGQIWSSKNLNVSRFNNGDTIFQALTPEDWSSALKLGKPAWCYYKNDPELGSLFGKLYNIYTVLDNRGIAPIGYHIPSNEEIMMFFENINKEKLGYLQYGGNYLRSTQFWKLDQYITKGLDKYGVLKSLNR